ncbi:Hypothetical predicted protein, partial [Mytilus galloprovincialis]
MIKTQSSRLDNLSLPIADYVPYEIIGSLTNSELSIKKEKSWPSDDSVGEIQMLKESDTSTKKEKSEGAVCSIEKQESLKKPRFHLKKDRAERSDGFLKKLNMRQRSVGIADQSGDETEILKNSDTSMKSDRT